MCLCVRVCEGADGRPCKRPGSAGELGEGEAAEGGSSHPLNGRRSAPTPRGESVATRRLLGVLGRAKWGAPPGICVGLPGNPRPGPFSSRAESGWSEASRRGEGASRRGGGASRNGRRDQGRVPHMEFWCGHGRGKVGVGPSRHARSGSFVGGKSGVSPWSILRKWVSQIRSGG